jgi:pyruvate/2-oxoacid:ferredoxin oxidoreductase beta subunit
MSSWELEKEESAKVITINTDAKITKIGNNLSIDSGKKKKDVTISGFDSIYNDS